MKVTFFLLFFTLLSGSISGQTNPNGLFLKKGFHGNVKVIRERITKSVVESNDYNIEPVGIDKQFSFDDGGKLEEISVFKNNRLFSTLRYFYDADSTATNAIEYNADGSIYLTIQYSIDENGFINEELYDRTEQKTYDENRASVDVEFFAFYQQLFTRIIIKNDFLGRVLEQKFLTEDGEMSFKLVHEYDFRGNRTSTKYYHKSGLVSWQTKYQYDKFGRLKLKKIFKNSYLAQTTKYSYENDGNNNWIQRTGTSKVINNIFGQLLKNEIEIVNRTISYK